MENDAPPLKAWLLLGLLALIWGSSFLLIKKGLLGFSPDQLAAIRIASAGFFFFRLFCVASKQYVRIIGSNLSASAWLEVLSQRFYSLSHKLSYLPASPAY